LRPVRLAALALGVIAALAPAPGARAESPRAVVETMTDRVIDILRRKELPSEERRRRVEDVVYAHVDFPTLSRLVLARNWARFSPAQQEEFVEEFRRHLAATYGRRVDDYRNEEVVVTGQRDEPRGDVTVLSRIPRAGEEILVDYRLRRQADGSWRIIDFIIEGVSLVANFRSQFQGIVSARGPEGLLADLREKTARGEVYEAAPAAQ
jgi:phospholipid transport system substrate-binding protein